MEDGANLNGVKMKTKTLHVLGNCCKHPVETDHLKHEEIFFICRTKNDRHFQSHCHFVGHQIEIANHERSVSNVDA